MHTPFFANDLHILSLLKLLFMKKYLLFQSIITIAHHAETVIIDSGADYTGLKELNESNRDEALADEDAGPISIMPNEPISLSFKKQQLIYLECTHCAPKKRR